MKHLISGMLYAISKDENLFVEEVMGVSRETVSQEMTRHVVYIEQNQSLAVAWEIMREWHIRHLPVVDSSNLLVGVLSDRDILLNATKTDTGDYYIDSKTVREAMTADPLTCEPSTPVYRVAGIMVDKKIDCLPVVDDQGVLRGLITSTDLMQMLSFKDTGEFKKVIPFKYEVRRWDKLAQANVQ